VICGDQGLTMSLQMIFGTLQKMVAHFKKAISKQGLVDGIPQGEQLKTFSWSEDDTNELSNEI
jgi:uncharacterized membrane protein